MNISQKILLYYYIKIRASLCSVYSNKVQNGILKSILNADEVEGRGDSKKKYLHNWIYFGISWISGTEI